MTVQDSQPPAPTRPLPILAIAKDALELLVLIGERKQVLDVGGRPGVVGQLLLRLVAQPQLLAAQAEADKATINAIEGYFDFVDANGGTFMAEQLPSEDHKRLLVLDVRDAPPSREMEAGAGDRKWPVAEIDPFARGGGPMRPLP